MLVERLINEEVSRLENEIIPTIKDSEKSVENRTNDKLERVMIKISLLKKKDDKIVEKFLRGVISKKSAVIEFLKENISKEQAELSELIDYCIENNPRKDI